MTPADRKLMKILLGFLGLALLGVGALCLAA